MPKPKKTNEPQSNIEEIIKERDEYLAGWKRSLADLDNFKKQVEKEKEVIIQFLKAEQILKLIPIMDNFEKAFESVPENIKNNEWIAKHPELAEWAKGIRAIKNQIEDLLKKEGVEKIKTIGEKFNPEFHEALLEEESDKEEGIILEEFEPGYMMMGRVIKYPKVKVSKGKSKS